MGFLVQPTGNIAGITLLHTVIGFGQLSVTNRMLVIGFMDISNMGEAALKSHAKVNKPI